MRNKTIVGFACFFILFFLAMPSGRSDQITLHLNGRPVTAIVYDSKRAVVWFGTESGLFKFDGATLTPCQSLGPNSPCGSVKSLALDNEGNLWVGTGGKGASRLRLKDNIWETYNMKNGLIDSVVLSIAAGSNGNIWFGTQLGLGLFDSQNWFRYTTTHYAQWKPAKMKWDTLTTCYRTRKRLTHNQINVVAVDHHDKVWCGTERNISVLQNKCEWDTLSIGENLVSAVLVDHQNRKWFGAPDGPYKLDTTETAFEFTPAQFPPYLDDKWVYFIFQDYEKSLWFGTARGAPRLDPVIGAWREITGSPEIDGNAVRSMAADADGNLWFGSDIFFRRAVRYAANWVSFTPQNDDQPNKLGTYDIQAMALDRLGQIWAGTKTNLARYSSAGWKISALKRGVYAIAVARDNTLWIAAAGGLAAQISSNGDVKDTLQTGREFAFSVALSGDSLWVGTNRGLLLYNLKIRRAPIKIFRQHDLGGGPISDEIKELTIDWRGRLWCGSEEGASRYDGREWMNFTVANGLVDNHIQGITIDLEKHVVWFATQDGVSYLDATDNWKQITIANGLVDNNVNDIEIFNGRGEIWFATVNGVSCRDSTGNWITYTRHDGLADNTVTTIQPGPQPGDIWSDETWFGTEGFGVTRYRRPEKLPVTTISTPFDVVTQSEVIFEFLGRDLNTPVGQLRYSYKLDNKPWSPPLPNTLARIPVFNNGPHTFYVKTIDKDNNEDQCPAEDFFYKIDPAIGDSTSFIDTVNMDDKSLEVKITLYWPPHQLEDTSKITIVPVHPESAKKTGAKFAYDFTPFRLPINKNGAGAILAFEFPVLAAGPAQQYAIHRDLDAEGQKDGAILGGTQTFSARGLKITTQIDQLGRYALRARTMPAQTTTTLATAVNAQPRIFSPRGVGHGPQTTVTFKLEKASERVTVKVYNLAGRFIKNIFDARMNEGINAVVWDGRDYLGDFCPTGLYIITIVSDAFTGQKKVMILNE